MTKYRENILNMQKFEQKSLFPNIDKITKLPNLKSFSIKNKSFNKILININIFFVKSKKISKILHFITKHHPFMKLDFFRFEKNCDLDKDVLGLIKTMRQRYK